MRASPLPMRTLVPLTEAGSAGMPAKLEPTLKRFSPKAVIKPPWAPTVLLASLTPEMKARTRGLAVLAEAN